MWITSDLFWFNSFCFLFDLYWHVWCRWTTRFLNNLICFLWKSDNTKQVHRLKSSSNPFLWCKNLVKRKRNNHSVYDCFYFSSCVCLRVTLFLSRVLDSFDYQDFIIPGRVFAPDTPPWREWGELRRARDNPHLTNERSGRGHTSDLPPAHDRTMNQDCH